MKEIIYLILGIIIGLKLAENGIDIAAILEYIKNII